MDNLPQSGFVLRHQITESYTSFALGRKRAVPTLAEQVSTPVFVINFQAVTMVVNYIHGFSTSFKTDA